MVKAKRVSLYSKYMITRCLKSKLLCLDFRHFCVISEIQTYFEKNMCLKSENQIFNSDVKHLLYVVINSFCRFDPINKQFQVGKFLCKKSENLQTPISFSVTKFLNINFGAA